MRFGNRHRRQLSASVAQLLGVSVGIAVPVQRVDPRLVLGAAAVEIAAFAAALLTLSGIAFGATVLAGVVLVGLRLADVRRVMALTEGGVVIVAATASGRPVAAVGSAPAGFRFPAPAGMGVRIDVGSDRWWVDRSEFARLRRARELQETVNDQG